MEKSFPRMKANVGMSPLKYNWKKVSLQSKTKTTIKTMPTQWNTVNQEIHVAKNLVEIAVLLSIKNMYFNSCELNITCGYESLY